MKAMILAAGLGTRLRPLTDDRPKALVTVGGRTLLEITLRRLRTFAVSEVIVNTHHYAEMISKYLADNLNFGMRIDLSHEQVLLDTGGGLKAASSFFLDSGASSREPFILHNVDVLSTIDLDRMMRFHIEKRALATLAVQQRETARPLLFDDSGQLCGRQIAPALGAVGSKPELIRHPQNVQALAFSGIHIISPRIFAAMQEVGAFSIIPAYLHLAACQEKIMAFRADEYYWRDLGTPKSIMQASRDIEHGLYAIS